MGTNPNTLTIKSIWSNVYQISHAIAPVYKAFATERLATQLKVGNTIYRTYGSDVIVNEMGGDGSYSTQGLTDTDESLVVNQKPEVSFQIPDWITFQTHLPTQRYYAEKSMARLWNYIDGNLLNNMIYAAHYNQIANSTQTLIDNGIISGSTSDGAGITASIGNVATIFATATQQLQKNNVVYVPNKKFTGRKDDAMDKMTSAAITPEMYNYLTQFVGGKNSAKGDEVTTNGYVGYFFGFNVFVSNNLPWSCVISMTAQPSDNDAFKLGISSSVYQTIRFNTAIGTAGNILIGATATTAMTALAAFLNAPFTSGNAYYTPLVAGTYTAASTTTTYNGVMTQANAMTLFFKNTYAWVDPNNTSNTASIHIQVAGFGPCYLAVGSQNTGAATFPATKQLMHCLFGTSQSIDMVIQKTPNMTTNPVSSKVAKDFITWTLFGKKVFADQVPQLIDVQLLSSTHVAPVFTIA